MRNRTRELKMRTKKRKANLSPETSPQQESRKVENKDEKEVYHR